MESQGKRIDVGKDGGQDTMRLLLEQWLGLGAEIDENPDLRRVLFDSVTGLPTTPLLFPRISSLLEDRGEVSILCINVVRYSRIEEIYGWKVFDEVMQHVAEVLDEIAGEKLRDADLVAELMNSGNAFIIVLSPPRTTPRIDPAARISLALRIEEKIKEKLNGRVDAAVYSKFACYVGSSTVNYEEGVRLERLVYEGLDDALADSRRRVMADGECRIERLRSILGTEDVSALLQPVFDLATMEVIGYEALARGPEGSEFERPDKLFTVAYDGDLVMQLERLCRSRALESASKIPEGRLLFLNVEPQAIGDPSLREVSRMRVAGIEPERIVLEITERCAIGDFAAFRATLDLVKALGFSVAIDDAGAGYGSLQCLAEVRPDWLKVDMSLVRGCDSDEVRRSLIESLKRFADVVDSKLVAEGIETEEELATLKAMGVPYGQGYLMAIPAVDVSPEDERLAKRFIG